jgi:ribonuclease-3 family protein
MKNGAKAAEGRRKMTEETKKAPLPTSMALAYLGDAVHSLLVREHLVRKGISHSGDLNRAALAFVTATEQAKVARLLLPHLTEEESDVFRRAGNHHLQRPKHTSGADYRMATGLEAVFGMLHFRGEHDRIRALFAIGYESADPTEQKEENKEE